MVGRDKSKNSKAVEQFVLQAPHQYCMPYEITHSYLPAGRGSVSCPYPGRNQPVLDLSTN